MFDADLKISLSKAALKKLIEERSDVKNIVLDGPSDFNGPTKLLLKMYGAAPYIDVNCQASKTKADQLQVAFHDPVTGDQDVLVAVIKRLQSDIARLVD